jgi:hypothetical protein
MMTAVSGQTPRHVSQRVHWSSLIL